MKNRTYKGKISKKGFSPFSYRVVSREEAQGKIFTTEGVQKKKVFHVKSERSRRTEAVIGYCNISNFKEVLKRHIDKKDELTGLLNEFLMEMFKIIREEGGGMNRFASTGFYFFFPVKKEQKTAENKAVDTALKFRGQMNKLNRKWDYYREEAWSIGIGLVKGYAEIANYDDNLERASIVEDDISKYPRFLSAYVSSGKIVIDDRFYESHQFKDKELNISPSRHLAMRETGKTAKIYEIIGLKSYYNK